MKLSAIGIRSLTTPGRYNDGGGLYLHVRPTTDGTGVIKNWVRRYRAAGRKLRDLGLGSYPEVGLMEARERARAVREQLRQGADPIRARRVERAERARAAAERDQRTFRAIVEAMIAAKASGWRNEKHRKQWGSTLETYAYPKLGERDVQDITTAHVLEVLRPLWEARKVETGSRVRQRIEAVLDYARAIGVRTGDNPARWRGHLDDLLPKPSKVRRVEHHAALDWREAPGFMADLVQRDGTGAKALAFAILTAARSGEARGMKWGELAGDVWIVPPERIKSNREHRVPLTAAALALLGEPGEPDDLAFPNSRGGPLSDMTLTAVLRRMGRGDLTAHGFRSTFRDWAGETTHHPREVIEAALAHRLKDKAEAAYARGDLFAKRRALMQDWERYLASSPADVIELGDRQQA